MARVPSLFSPPATGQWSALKRWAEQVADDNLGILRGEVAMSFEGVEREDYDPLPVEVVVEWNQVLDLPFDDIPTEPPVD